MKQSFEVFEQSDGIALHLTVTVDSDAFARAESATEISLLRLSGSSARITAEQAIRQTLTRLPDAIRAAIQETTTKRSESGFSSIVEYGKRERQPEVDLLNAQVTSLRNQLAELAAAQKATKKPRTPRKAARK